MNRSFRIVVSLVLFMALLAPMLILIPASVDAATDDYFPSTETPTIGSVSGASFPGAIQVSDDSYRTPQEANTASGPIDVAPDAEQLTRGTSAGFTNLLSDDGANWVGTEAAVGGDTQQYTPGSSTKIKGTLTAGSEPTCWQTSDDSRCTYQEADQAGATTTLTPDTETLTTGTKVSGTFNADVISDNGVSITYREANTNGNTIAFDATVESEKTSGAGPDPYSWTHTPTGTPRAVIVSTAHGVTSTDHVLGVKYGTSACSSGSGTGGTSMTKVASALDGATEPGRADLWFLGAGIPTGNAQVCADLDSATTDLIHSGPVWS